MSRSPSPPDPLPSAELERLLLDLRHGGFDEAGRERFETVLRGTDAARVARMRDFLARVGAAHDEPPDRVRDAQRAAAISAHLRQEVGAEEERARREHLATTSPRPRTLFWARVLAVSVALHLVVLAVLTVQVHREERAREADRVRVGLPNWRALPEGDRDLAEIPSPWLPRPGEALFPDLSPPSSEIDGGGTKGLAHLPSELEPLDGHRYDHPPGLPGPMRNRLEEGRKRARLRRLGLDDDLTLAAVARGLRALAVRQHQDGSFPTVAGGRSPLAETALALLPFLGDGHASKRGSLASEVVAPGIAWVRARVFDDDGRLRADAGGGRAPDLGMALKALSEDYALSYGRLRPFDARRRADEIAALAERVGDLQRPDGTFTGAGDDLHRAVWPMWGLDAAARTGVVVPPAEIATRFATFFAGLETESATGDGAGLLLARHLGEGFRREVQARAARVASAPWDAETDPFVAATTSTGLLRESPEAFRIWSRGLGDWIAQQLLPTGIARRGDPVGDTALVLLALQAAYRVY